MSLVTSSAKGGVLEGTRNIVHFPFAHRYPIISNFVAKVFLSEHPVGVCTEIPTLGNRLQMIARLRIYGRLRIVRHFRSFSGAMNIDASRVV